MKVLQLCPKPPKPAVDGGCIAMNNVTNGLILKGIEVKILAISTHKHPLSLESLDVSYKQDTRIEGVFVDTKLNIVDAFSNLVTSDSYNISRFFSPDFNKLLRETLEEEEFDVVHLESLFMTPYIGTIRSESNAKIVLRSHNLEYMIWERLADAASNMAKKMYLNILAKQLKKYEIRTLSEVDGIAAISKEDLAKYESIGSNKPMVTIPFGIDAKQYKPDVKSFPERALRIFHLGAMNWSPNLEGVHWVLEAVWPEVIAARLQAELHLAGRDMPDWIFEEEQDFVVNHGEVDSAQEFMRTNDIMVVPLFSAGGMRVKIIEGMALGKVIITTSIGAEGIDCEDGVNILIADTAEAFVEKIKWLCDNPNQFEIIGKNATELVQNHYDNELITERLLSFYQEGN